VIRAAAVSPTSFSDSTSAFAMSGKICEPSGYEVSRGLDVGGVLSGMAGMEDMAAYLSGLGGVTMFISVAAATAS
jgi:hypothetical protein